MRLPDYSPPSSPPLDQQRDALQKGLGRAMQWALAGRLDDEALVSACVKDLRHDVQVESSRADWLWNMIQAADAVDRLRVPILHALYDLSDVRSADQICSLAGEYARAGHESFRARLNQIVEQKPFADEPRLGEDEIIAIDGEPAFLFAASAGDMARESRPELGPRHSHE